MIIKNNNTRTANNNNNNNNVGLHALEGRRAFSGWLHADGSEQILIARDTVLSIC